MRKTATVDIGDETIEEIEKMDMSIPQFLQQAIDTLLSNGWEDYSYMLKLNIVEKNIVQLEGDIKIAESKLRYMKGRLRQLEDMHETSVKIYEESKKINEQLALMQRLNKIIIFNSYDEGVVRVEARELIFLIQKYVPDFDITSHMKRLKMLNR